MPVWQILLLGIVQGLTEFLPISSTAHLLLVQELLGRSREEVASDPFTVVIQLGTLVAVFWYFRNDIIRLLRGAWQDVLERRLVTSASTDGRTAKLIVLGTLPVVVAGLLMHRWLKSTFYNPLAIGCAAIVFALIMAASEWWSARRQAAGLPLRGDDDITWVDALWIGCIQTLALIPGGSRSGTTISAGLFAGMSRPTAARFSFLLSLPSILAAGVKELYDWFRSAQADPVLQERMYDQAFAMLLGATVSAVVGYLSIAWLLHYLRAHTTLAFVLYRIGVGIIILTLIATGFLAE